MEIKPVSFFLGVGAALALPLVTKLLRPLAVEVMATGMGVVDEARRLIAEQMEVMEDIAAEARAKREAQAAQAPAGLDEEVGAVDDEQPAEDAEQPRPRRRPAGLRRGH
jgi:Protein of unknown function (DUF5132)